MIYIDCLSAIYSLQNYTFKSLPTLLHNTLYSMHTLIKKKRANLQLCHIAAHSYVKPNEVADSTFTFTPSGKMITQN